MTGWTILALTTASAWVCLLAIVWLLCRSAARADHEATQHSAFPLAHR